MRMVLLASCLVVACSSPPDGSPRADAGDTPGDVGGDPSDAGATDRDAGSDTGGDVPDLEPPAPLTASGYCEASVDFFCDYYIRCGRIVASDVEECRERFLESCNAVYEPRYVAYEEAGLVSLSEDGLEECGEHLASVACEHQLFDLDLGCSEVWIGTQGLDSPCSPGIGSFVCKPGTVCTLDLTLCGTCKAAGIAGDPCGGETRCQTGLQCVEGECAQRALPGASCAAAPCVAGASCIDDVCRAFDVVMPGEPCGQDARCAYHSTCRAGVCVEDAALGESCTERACASGWCDDGVCVARRPAGSDCVGSDECANGLCFEGSCAELDSACFPD